MNVLVVCAANLVRSPVGEAALRAGADRHGFSSFHVSSGGISAAPGGPPPPELLEVVRFFFLDLSEHRSRVVTRDDVRRHDLVLAMTEEQRAAVQSLLPAATPRVFTVKEFVRLTADLPTLRAHDGDIGAWVQAAHRARPRTPAPPQPEDVEDAYGRSMARYRACVKEIVGLMDRVIDRLG